MENPVELVNRWKPAGSAALAPEPEADADGFTDGLAADGLAEGRADADALGETAGGAARCDPGEWFEVSTRLTTTATITTTTTTAAAASNTRFRSRPRPVSRP